MVGIGRGWLEGEQFLVFCQRRGGLGKVNSAGRDNRGVQAQTQARLQHQRLACWSGEWLIPILATLMARPVLAIACLWTGTQPTLKVARHVKKSEAESQFEYQKVQEGQASSAAQAAAHLPQGRTEPRARQLLQRDRQLRLMQPSCRWRRKLKAAITATITLI
jgi:hypothetical protein